MNTRERFRRVMRGKPVDRLPVIEWVLWWKETLERWYGEGLPRDLPYEDIQAYLGLDVHRWIWLHPRSILNQLRPAGWARSQGLLAHPKDYERVAEVLHAGPQFDTTAWASIAAEQARGDVFVWLQIDGFFWFPREVMGIEGHLYGYYDQPELIHRINNDLVEYNIQTVRQLCQVLTPDIMTFAEDMSYNHGPMLSKKLFDEFMAPYYRRIVPELKARGIIVTVDSDGDIMPVIPWLEEVGIEGISPLERMAGVDVAAIRAAHPRWCMIGAFDKTVMHLGEAAMRREFERLLPVMRSGRYIPSVDHQTPPDVSLEQYRTYVSLLKEYAVRGAGHEPGNAETSSHAEETHDITML